MDGLKWIKIVTDIFDDEKILLIEQLPDADTIIVIWFKLLCLAGKQNNSGVIMVGRLPCTDEMLAAIFRRPVNTVKLALSTFESLGMIEVVNNCITIPKWEEHQKLDAYERSKELTRTRVANYRERQKQLVGTEENDVTLQTVTVTPQNRLDKNREAKNREDKNSVGGTGGDKPLKRFVQPTLDEVRAYCNERKKGVDAEQWYDYYSANGWKVGRNPMKDWKASVRYWERKEKEKAKNGARGVYISDDDERLGRADSGYI